MRERKVRFVCTEEEKKILLDSLLQFRNRVLREGKPQEDLDLLLEKLLRK